MILEPSKINNESIARGQIESLEKEAKEYTLLGKIRKIPGHTLFSFNYKTGEIKVAELIKSNTVSFVSKRPLHGARIDIEPDCYYEQALNKRNFIKRLVRRGILAIKSN